MLNSSVQGEDGSGAGITSTGGGGYEFGVDPNDDPELALALRWEGGGMSLSMGWL